MERCGAGVGGLVFFLEGKEIWGMERDVGEGEMCKGEDIGAWRGGRVTMKHLV